MSCIRKMPVAWITGLSAVLSNWFFSNAYLADTCWSLSLSSTWSYFGLSMKDATMELFFLRSLLGGLSWKWFCSQFSPCTAQLSSFQSNSPMKMTSEFYRFSISAVYHCSHSLNPCACGQDGALQGINIDLGLLFIRSRDHTDPTECEAGAAFPVGSAQCSYLEKSPF